MAQNNINQNGNFHTPLSPMRFQSSMGKEVKRKYKDGKNMVRLSLARVTKVNYKYNTVDVVTIQDKNDTTKNPNDNGRFSARLPVQFGGQTPDGKVFGTNTLVTVGCLVLVGFLEGHKDNPIVLNIYGDVDNQSMLTRTTFTGADESDEALQAELWQLFTLYPSMTYKNIDGHGNQEVTFPGKTFFFSSEDSRVNDAFFDYDHLPSSSYANGDLIEPTVPEAPNMLYVHQSLVDNHRVTLFVKSDGTVRVGSRHNDGQGVTFWQLNTDGSFKIQQSNDTVDPEDQSSNFSSFAIEEDGTIALQSGDNLLTIGSNGLSFNGGAINGGSLDLSNNETIKTIQGDIATLQQTTTTDGIITTVTDSTPWHDINQQVGSKATTFIATPAPPYNIGDIWENGGKVYVCTVPKGLGATFAQSDWTLSGDVTSQNTAADTTNVNGTPASNITSGISSAQSTATTAQTTAQAKSEMFLSQPTPPYNKGDVWNDNGVMYVANITRPDGATFLMADWTKAADVTANNTSADTANVNGTPASSITSGISSAQSAASSAQSTANSASSAASTAQSTADGKARTFTATPVPPYSLGDMWNQSGKVYSCITPKSSTGAFNAMDWVLVADMTSQNTAADTTNVNGQASSTLTATVASNTSAASNAQSTANSAQSLATSKAKAFITQPVTPYSVGDVWDNGSTVYICQTARSTGAFVMADWKLAGDVTANNTAADTSAVNGTSSSTVISNISTAQSTANSANSLATSKAKGFVTQPVPPYSVGDVWDNNGTVYICSTARSTGSFTQSDWQLSGDVTSNNTAKDTAAVNGQSSSTLTSTVSSNTTAASNAQTTANSKAKTFTSQPTLPYNLGDIYKNGQTVYVCTTARSTGSYTASDWTLVGDVTSQNTANDTTNVNGQSSSTLTSTVSSNTTAASNAQSAASSAQSTANSAQSLAQSKAEGFVSQPVPPYSVGDVWNNNGTVYICHTAKASGNIFSAADWVLAGDVTANNTANDTSKVNGQSASTLTATVSSNTTAASNAQSAANTAQSTANSKAKGFVAQPTTPYSAGDIWNNNGTVYICTTARLTGSFTQSDWTLSGDVTANNTAADTAKVNGQSASTLTSTVSSNTTAANNAQTTANSKAKGFTSQPTIPYNAGDVWNNSGTVYICTTARATGVFTQSDWTLAGDVTSNNTAKDTAAVNGTTSSTVISNISTAQSTANTANTNAGNAQTAANNAQTTANSKAQGFTSQPAPPYNKGDVWNNGGTVYICTTARASGGYVAGDWTLAGDVTANNTASDTAHVNGQVASTVTSNISTAQTTATNAQTTANSKAKTFNTTPTAPYNVGDIWNNSGKVYVATVAETTTYNVADWVLAGDVTANNTANDTTNVNGVASATVNSNISTAQTSANNAQTTANSKAKGFVTQPTTPYSLGDIYNNGGTVYICTTARASGGYVAGDWTLSGDVTANNTASDTAKVNGTSASTVISNISTAQSTANTANTNAGNAQTAANNAQTTANSKAQTFTSTPVPPYNVGDIYKNGGSVYVCTTAKASNGTYAAGDFVLAGDVTSSNTAADTSAVNGTSASTVISNISTAQSTANTAQTTANSKAKGFVAQPATPYTQGDVWNNSGTVYICTTTRASGAYTASDWTKVGDVTSANTAADTTNVNGTSSSTVISNISTAQSTASSASSAASAAQTSANTAQTTANSKAQTFTTTPAPPYSVGDIYKNGAAVYVCTTAKASGNLYSAADFTLVGDVTANNTAADTSAVNGTASSTVIGNISSANTAATNAQTTANSKAKTFTSQPTTPYSTGDIYRNGSTIYVCTTARASGSYTGSDWTLVGDVTANNTASDTAHVNGQVASTLTSTVSSNTTAASNAQSTANSANTAATNAQTTANSKAQTFTTTPAPPYNVGDIYKNGSTVYVCTTAKTSGGTYVASDFTLVGDVTANNTSADTSAVNGTSSSTVISNISSASSAASTAQTTANSKAKTFTATPTVPYNVGDIYQTTNAVYICTTARPTGSYTAGDWYKAGDVTSANTAADTSAVNGTASSTVISNISSANTAATNAQSTANSANTAATNAQTTANSKAQTFTATPTIPYSLGDIYRNGSTIYVCTTARASGSYTAGDWTLVGDVTANNTAADTAHVNGTVASTVTSNITTAQNTANSAQTTANSKSKTFTSTPTAPYNIGDLYQTGGKVYVATVAETTTYNAGDWVLAGDVTSQNTASDTANVNGVASATVNSNISSANTAATNAQTTANSKAKTFTAQPTTPYNLGDIYQTTNAVYICTTARASGGYVAGDWYKAGDVTSANTANDTSNVNGVASATVNSNISSASSAASAAQTTANSKAKTYTAQPAPPYNTGDVWQTTNAVYICTAGRASGSYTASDWYKAGDVTSANTAADTTNVNGTASATVISNISSANSAASAAQTTANGKAKVYTSQPAPPYNVGDIWQNSGSVYVCTAARASGSYTASDWYKAGDVTSQNTAADVTNVNGTPASTVISNISTAQSTANNAQTAVNNLQVGGRNLIYGQGWGSNPTANWDSTGYYVEVHLNTVLQPNTTYTFSYQYSVLKGTEANLFVGIGGGNSGQYNMDYIAWANTPITQKVFTFTTPSTLSYPYFQWRPWINKPNDGTEVSVNFWNIKLEKGNKATDWTPAPEDVQAYTDLASIGGRNYLRNTSNFPDLTNWGLNVGSGVTVTQNISSDATYGAVVDTYVSANGTTNNWIVIQNVGLTLPGGKFTVGNTYTVSFLMKNDLAMLVSFCDTNGTNGVAPASPTIPVSASWQRIVYTFTASATGNTPEFYLSANDTTHTGHILVTQLQLEDGTKATGYNPAPEDVNNQISTVASNVNNVMQGVFPSTMGSQIVNTVTSASTYVSALSKKADASDLANYATGDQLTQAQQAANSYTDQSIQGIDFSPYATTASLTQTSNQLTAQFTSSGGVNLLLNSVGHAVDITTKLPSFWNVVSGTPGVTSNPTLSQFGASSGLTLSGSTINQQVTVTPNVTYTLSAIVYKGTAGTGYIKVTDTSATPVKAETDFASGTAYSYQKISMNITPQTSTLTVEISGDATSGGVIFTCVMLNVGSTAFTWQQAPGEVYNTNVNFDLNGIRVMATDSNNKATSETIMTPTKFAGYSDLNGDGVIDTSTGSVDEVFRMDKDTFVMKNATIGPIKIVAVTGTHTGFAFVPNS